LTPEAIAGAWKEITDFSSNTTHPESPAEATSLLLQSVGKALQTPKGGNKVLEKAQSVQIKPVEYKYDNLEGIDLIILC
jgi:hypothetical protein